MNLEQEYKAMDFSRFSKVKDSLRQKLREERKNVVAPINVKMELNFDDLDYAAAAGNPNARSDRPNEDAEKSDK